MIRGLAAAFAAFLVYLCGGPAYAGVWVSTELTDIPADQIVKAAAPAPVQLLFQFQTNGAPNARAVTYLKDKVIADVKNTGVFSDVSDAPAANGAILSITINNFGDRKAAEAKGFGTGLTFGLKGSVIADEYAATGEYVPGEGAAKITAQAHHKLYTIIGIAKPPTDAVKVKDSAEGVQIITAQLISHLVNDIAKDPGFSGASASAAPAMAAAAVAGAHVVEDGPPPISPNAGPAQPTSP